MFLLDAALAQSIVDRARQILHTNVNVMDERDLIIASGERTLAAWFAHDMKSAPSAAALHVHRNTLDYRLRRIAELTGMDLARLDDCLLLFIGLELEAESEL